MYKSILKLLAIFILLSLITQACKDEELDICTESSPVASADVSGSNITANASGGTTPYTYAWSNNEITQTISGLANGSYVVTVTDNNGCTVSASATITNIPGCLGNTLAVTTEVSGTSITANVTGGTNPYAYNWSNNESSQTITDLNEGAYSQWFVKLSSGNSAISY